MQVNSAQDYLTMRKRQIVAATYHQIPPPQTKRYNSVFTTAMANGASRYQLVVNPNPSAWGTVRGSETYISNLCCLSNAGVAPGVFATTTGKGWVRLNLLQPMSVTATRPTV
jgi:hypothetical protein